MRRPMERVAAPLRLMGAQVLTQDGHPPVRVRGTRALRAIEYALPVASAQVKSAMLLAALRRALGRVLTEPAASRDHTERMLRRLRCAGCRKAVRTLALDGGQPLQAPPVQVPGDFSSAAFFVVAGCLAREAALLIRTWGQSDAHRPRRDPQGHGRRHPRASP